MFFTSLLSSLFSYLGNLNKQKIIIRLVFVSVIIFGIFYIKKLNQKVHDLTIDNNRQKSNIENMYFDIDSTKRSYSTKILSLKNDELKNFSKDIDSKLRKLDLKLKNVSSVSNIVYHYSTIFDTIKSKEIINQPKDIFIPIRKYDFNYDMDKIKYSGTINVPDLTLNDKPFLTETKIEFNDSLLITDEKIYKRKFIFWKKLEGLKLHIKSSNEKFKLDKIQTYKID